jgi:hypothetical protein
MSDDGLQPVLVGSSDRSLSSSIQSMTRREATSRVFLYLVWLIILFLLFTFARPPYISLNQPFSGHGLRNHYFHFDFDLASPTWSHSFAILDVAFFRVPSTLPEQLNLSLSINSTMDFASYSKIVSGSHRFTLNFVNGVSNRIRIFTASFINFESFHADLVVAFPPGIDLPGTFYWSFDSTTHCFLSISVRSLFCFLALVWFVHLVRSQSARFPANRAAFILALLVVVAGAPLFVVTLFYGLPGFRILDVFLILVLVCYVLYVLFWYDHIRRLFDIGFWWYLKTALPFVAGGCIVGFFALRNAAEFRADFVFRANLIGHGCELALVVLYIGLVAKRSWARYGQNRGIGFVYLVLVLAFPVATAVWRVCVLVKPLKGSGLGFVDFASAAGAAFFFLGVRNPDGVATRPIQERLNDGEDELTV